MYVCMCMLHMCIYVYVYIYTHIYIYIYIYTYIHILHAHVLIAFCSKLSEGFSGAASLNRPVGSPEDTPSYLINPGPKPCKP